MVRGYYAEGRGSLSGLLAAGPGGQAAAARAKALNGAGVLAWRQGDNPSAQALHEESLAISRGLGDRWGIASSLDNLGSVADLQGDYPSAQALHAESLAIRWELGDRDGIAWSLEGLAYVALALAAPSRAARIWSAAERLREEIGAPLPPDERLRYDRQVVAARAVMGDDAALDLAWQEGRAMTLEQAIEYALEKPAA